MVNWPLQFFVFSYVKNCLKNFYILFLHFLFCLVNKNTKQSRFFICIILIVGNWKVTRTLSLSTTLKYKIYIYFNWTRSNIRKHNIIVHLFRSIIKLKIKGFILRFYKFVFELIKKNSYETNTIFCYDFLEDMAKLVTLVPVFGCMKLILEKHV